MFFNMLWNLHLIYKSFLVFWLAEMEVSGRQGPCLLVCYWAWHLVSAWYLQAHRKHTLVDRTKDPNNERTHLEGNPHIGANENWGPSGLSQGMGRPQRAMREPARAPELG
jgi:hypothetical protein